MNRRYKAIGSSWAWFRTKETILRQSAIHLVGLHLSFLALSMMMTSAPLAAEPQNQPALDKGAASDLSLWMAQKAWIDQTWPKALRPTTEPDLWEVAIAESGKLWRTFDFVRVLTSFAIVPPDRALSDALAQSSYTLLDRQMVVGSVASGTGRPRYVAALVMDFGQTYMDPEGKPARPFAPVFVSDGLEETTSLAREMAQIYNGEAPLGLVAGNHLSFRRDCEDGCDAEFQEAMNLAVAAAALCVGIATAAGVACILACPPCAPACLIAQALASAHCLVVQKQDQRAAIAELLDCTHDCIVVP